MNRQIVQTDAAPSAIGPYSQAVVCGNLVFCSGQIGLKPGSPDVRGSIEEQTRQVLDNLKAVLSGAGCTMDQVVKTTVFLTDINDFPAMNAVYGTYFGDAKPARATVEVSALPKDAFVEIDCIAMKA